MPASASSVPRFLALAAAASVVATAPLAAQNPKFDFTIRNIMRGPEVYGREPTQVRWTPDGQWIYFQWLPPGSDWRDLPKPYRVRAQAGAKPEAVGDAQMDAVAALVAPGVIAPDRTRRISEYRGELWLVDLKASTVKRLTETVAQETNARFSSDGRSVIFVRDGNAYLLELATGATRQLTDIRTPPDAATAAAAAAAGAGGRGGRGGRGGGAADPPPVQQGRGGRGANPQRTALEEDQKRLFQVIRDQQRADSIRRAETRDDPEMPRTVNLMPNERVAQISVSPSGTAVLFTTQTGAADARTGNVPNYVTSSGYTEDIPNRTKVGDVLAAGRLGFMTLPRGNVVWIKPIDGDDTAPANQNVTTWNEAGTAALVSATTRSWKTRQLSVVDGKTGAIKAVEVMRDTAWVGGPCANCAGFYDNDRRIYWVSETNGWAQLHSAAADASDRRELTGLGKWEIYDVALTADKQNFLFHSSEISAFDRDFWSMPLAGGARNRLTHGAGGHQAVLSPDEMWMADVYSTNNRPPEIFLGAACIPPKGCDARPTSQLTLSPTAEWLAGPWTNPEIVWITASDGVKVPAHIYKPKDFGAKNNGAAVIFVHGAGYAHEVHHYWKGNYAREYMFNHFLASKGYVVLDIDYRASAGYGRDWRTAIYRWMGGRDLGDQVDGSKYLTKEYGIHPERIGMYGGSYGGFMTLMALFTAPKYFGAGAALRSVTDWAHYNHQYTSQILNQPQDDTLAYHRSSPIFLAEGLEDPLLMLHGMVDTNVNFQDIVRLTQRLIELGKTDWSLAPYPVEDHGFQRPTSWADEYRRIFELYESTIGPKGSKAKL
ncbi:MAG: prolyl oligopeptidase family serine peptidase [Gemmatimonadales bacterium]